MKRVRLHGSRQTIWLEVDRGAGLPERLVATKAMPSSCETEHPASNVEHFDHRIKVGDGKRQVNAYVFDPPHNLIEIHAEPGYGTLTANEAEALSEWLHRQAQAN
jgi:hypothetical protein